MKILVTGSAGFIGSHLVLRLLQRGDTVVGIDNHNTYYDPAIKEARIARWAKHPNYTHIRCDIADKAAMESAFALHKPDRVVHLAAQAGVRYSIENPMAYIESNIVGFAHVLEGCRHHEVEHLVYASSSSVYGANTAMPFSVHHNVDHPLSLYAASKKSNELMAHTYSHLYRLPTTGLRFFTVYGPWGRPDMAYLRVINSALNGSEFKKFGNGEVKRDFTFVDDITRMIESLAFQLKTCQAGFADVVNIGGGNPHSLNDLVREVSNQMNLKITVSETSINPLDTDYTFADVTRLIELTGQKPEIRLETGVSETIAWAKRPDIRSSLSSWVESTI